MNEKTRVICLYRVSTLGQVEKNDIPMQRQRCREFAAEQGWTIIKEFSEKGISGYKVSASEMPSKKFKRKHLPGPLTFSLFSCLTVWAVKMTKHLLWWNGL